MRRSSCLTGPGLFLLLACTPATGGIGSGDGSGSDTSEAATGTGTESDCIGQSGCACTPGGGCDPGLACVEDMCEPEAGDGDGDGDPAGDGDGEGDGDGDPGCSHLGCMCDGSLASCDPGLACEDGVCAPSSCGNGTPDDGEVCDDGNNVGGDGCETDCTLTTVAVVASGQHTCALIEGGSVRCWGLGGSGQLGYGTTEDIGDDETPASAGDVPLPGSALSIDLGDLHSCALFGDNSMGCWGGASLGQLGNSSNVDLGNDETLELLDAIMLGGTATQFSAGGAHTCARLDSGDVRCWGDNGNGQLGIGNTTRIGDDEHASAAPLVGLGPSDVALVATGYRHSCAVTVADDLFCWGLNGKGQLGLSTNASIGDNEPANDSGPVDVRPMSLPNNATIAQLALGKEHSCALFSSGDVLCWGHANHGQLGQGNKTNWGDQGNEPPSALTPISLGGPAKAISAGDEFSCALLEDGTVRCWGSNDIGQLGLGHKDDIGDNANELPSSVDPIDLGELTAISISSGIDHTCAVLEDYSVVCWGSGASGRLGYANANDIGDDETPASVGAISLF
ncbi:RCC1 domain-containing protein [Enhygromyxa salina]|uniref:Regulator of chromosome condensation (RCC1) repeat protein n=1 Tax=Enhygromyxa salina TaxID=215803 RepID=A0A2S9YK88_9BACT|nr:hypothetical protein [Enhygromyxa salina]PRQ05521.1 Regulator of chromosome condensation (RCC1) repeat protein [Enhygromyxa salina]